MLATTATANNRVVDDVQAQLGDGIRVVRGPLVRHSLGLQNVILPNPIDRYAWIVSLLRTIDGTGIIYTLTVRDAIRTAFPPQAHVSEVLEALEESDSGLSTYELEASLNLSHAQIEKTLKFLSVEDPASVAKDGSKWSATAHSHAYQVNRERIDDLTALRRRE